MLVIPLDGITPTLAPGKVEVLQAPSSFAGDVRLIECRRLKSLKHSEVEVSGNSFNNSQSIVANMGKDG